MFPLVLRPRGGRRLLWTGMFAFRLGSIPIRVQATVLLIGVFIYMTSRSIELAVLWTLALVITVLTHELGHALVVLRVGGQPEVTVWAFGGYTAWIPAPDTTWRHRFAIAAAGSLMQFTVAFLLWLGARAGWMGRDVQRVLGEDPFSFPVQLLAAGPVLALLALVIYFGMVWSVFNWIPIAGLDGAHMLQALLTPRLGERVSQRAVSVVSVVVAAALAGWLLWRGERTLAVFVLVIAAAGLR